MITGKAEYFVNFNRFTVRLYKKLIVKNDNIDINIYMIEKIIKKKKKYEQI